MPDLSVETDECESPFWLDHLIPGSRRRAAVRRINDRWCLAAPNNDRFEFDPALDGWHAAEKLKTFLATHDLRLSPRALTLTLYLRLLLVDQFIHGIGGGRYDQVTDALISSHFGIAPPKFCVTTATLYHPAAAGRTRIDLPHLSHEGHQLRHRALGDEKRKIVDHINALPRRSLQRQSLFSQMRTQITNAAQTNTALKQWESNYQSALTQSRDDRQIFDRELFYALQPRERLIQLIRQYRSRFAQ